MRIQIASSLCHNEENGYLVSARIIVGDMRGNQMSRPVEDLSI
jgi:hypothetical protein